MLPSQEVGSGKPLGLPLFLWKIVGGAGLKSWRYAGRKRQGLRFFTLPTSWRWRGRIFAK